MKTKHIIQAVGILLICGTIVFLGDRLSKTDIKIQNTGTSSGTIQNSISVSGEGKVQVAPDIVRITAGVSELGKTTKEAQEKANDKLNQILNILEKNNIAKRDMQTTNLSFYPEYDWKDGERIPRGQRVRQSLNIKVRDIDDNSERVTDILDALGEIDGLELNSVNFDIEDKEAFFSQAREKAFEKAEQKAKELAKMGGVELLKPITISEANMDYSPLPYRNFAKAEMVMDAGMGGGGSSLPSGELEVIANISVVYGTR